MTQSRPPGKRGGGGSRKKRSLNIMPSRQFFSRFSLLMFRKVQYNGS